MQGKAKKYFVNKDVFTNQTVLLNISEPCKDCFNNLFCQNILNVYNVLAFSTLSQDTSLIEKSCMSTIGTFEPVIETDIRQLLKRSSSAVCYMAFERVSGCSDKPD